MSAAHDHIRALLAAGVCDRCYDDHDYSDGTRCRCRCHTDEADVQAGARRFLAEQAERGIDQLDPEALRVALEVAVDLLDALVKLKAFEPSAKEAIWIEMGRAALHPAAPVTG